MEWSWKHGILATVLWFIIFYIIGTIVYYGFGIAVDENQIALGIFKLGFVVIWFYTGWKAFK